LKLILFMHLSTRQAKTYSDLISVPIDCSSKARLYECLVVAHYERQYN